MSRAKRTPKYKPSARHPWNRRGQNPTSVEFCGSCGHGLVIEMTRFGPVRHLAALWKSPQRSIHDTGACRRAADDMGVATLDPRYWQSRATIREHRKNSDATSVKYFREVQDPTPKKVQKILAWRRGRELSSSPSIPPTGGESSGSQDPPPTTANA